MALFYRRIGPERLAYARRINGLHCSCLLVCPFFTAILASLGRVGSTVGRDGCKKAVFELTGEIRTVIF